MKLASLSLRPDPKVVGLIAAALIIFGLAATCDAQIEGFLEPYRSVDLSSDETGTIYELGFREGEKVMEGDVVARLDDRVQKLQLELAIHLANTKSNLHAAEKMHEKRLAVKQRIEQLLKTNNASESELLRADMELSIAKSKLLSAQEEMVTREIEARKARAVLERRSIVAPMSGVISKIHRKEGEFISPLRPEVATIVQLDRLYAKFNIPGSMHSTYQVGQQVKLEMGEGNFIEGIVESIAVQTDAESSTVEIKFLIDNSDFQIRSGEIVTLDI